MLKSQKSQSSKWQWSSYYWPFLIILAIFAASSVQRLAAPDLDFEFSTDKLAHFLVFGLLATSIVRTQYFKKNGLRGAFSAVCLTSLYGICDELRQSMTPGRSVEFADWIADTAGASVAVIFYIKWKAYRNLLEWRPSQKRGKTST